MKIIEKNVKKQQKTDYFENTTKPSLFQRVPVFLKITFSGKQTQFPNSENHYNYLQRRDLQRFTPRIPTKKQTQNKPKQTQFQTQSQLSTLYFLLSTLSDQRPATQSKPNFRHQSQFAALISWRKPFQEPTPHHHGRKVSIGHQSQFQRDPLIDIL
ncbi:MAG TPA: hypothetical protein ENH94_04590 [Phycisphaerales bacterium]|nr:hypothetical protein [Phycisphaerales bacterium]